MALPPHVDDESKAHEQRQTEQDNVDRNRVVVKRLMGSGIEGGLREVEETCKTDDEAVYFAKGGEAEDFGGVVADGEC